MQKIREINLLVTEQWFHEISSKKMQKHNVHTLWELRKSPTHAQFSQKFRESNIFAAKELISRKNFGEREFTFIHTAVM